MRKRFVGVLGCLLVLATGAGAGVYAELRPAPPKQRFWLDMQFTPDGQRLLAVVAQRHNFTKKISPRWLLRWDTESGRQLSRVELPAVGSLQQIVLSPDGRLFYRPPVQGEEGKLTLRSPATGQPVRELEANSRLTVPKTFSADGRLLATSHSENSILEAALPAGLAGPADSIQFWDTISGKQVPLFARESEAEHLNTTLFSQDNRLVVRVGTKSEGGEKPRPWAVVFDRHTGRRLKAFFIGEKVMDDYQLSPNGRTLIGMYSLGHSRVPPQPIPLWDTQSGKLLHSLKLTLGDWGYTALRFSADSSQLRALGTTYTRQFRAPLRFWKQSWSIASGQELPNNTGPIKAGYRRPPRSLTPIYAATSDRLLARVTNGNRIQLYEQENWKLVWEIKFDLGA